MLKVGFIGFGIHAIRLKKCLSEILDAHKIVFYHPTKHDTQITNDFNDICGCDVVFITSPNQTHYDYIKQLLQKSNSKIFCEKPPCVTAFELDELRRLSPESKGRIFINFNYRYSNLCHLIKSSIADGSIGSVINIKGVLSHGLAFKEGYPHTWRGKYPNNKSVVLDTSLIHLIDLCNYVLDGPLEIKISSSSTYSHGLDSFFLGLEAQNKANISLFGSYAAPYCFSLQVLGTNGLIEASDTSLVLKAPRDTFNEEGFFITPPECINNKYSFELDYENSLRSAVSYFISQAISGENLSIIDFDLSLDTTKLICDAQLSD